MLVAKAPRVYLDLPSHPRRLTASHGYTCSIEADGKLWCWGARTIGQKAPPTMLGEGAVYISASQEPYGELCSIGSDGTSGCWGLGTKDAIDVGSGSRYACALDKRGVVHCTGANIPRDVPPATQLSVGPTHACARLDDGGVYCWGQNFLGQLGFARSSGSADNVEGRVPITDVAGVACGSAFTCAWKTDGSVWCWGDKAFNGLGSLGTSAGHVAHPEPVRVPGVQDAVSVTAGANHIACALDRSGAVTCWGHDYQGALGADVQGDAPPTRIAFSQPVEEIAIGGAHTCVRAKAGGVWCWGWNEYGQLGSAAGGSTWRAQQVAIGTTTASVAATPTAVKRTTLASGAQRVEVTLDSAESLRAAGWHRLPGGMSTFEGGAMHIEANGFEEWSLGANDAIHNPFMGEAGNPPGWAIEAKLKLDAPCAKLGTGFWIHDGFHFVQLRINDHEVSVGGVRADIGSTLTPRLVRIVVDGASLTLSVDGKVVGHGAVSEGMASKALMFGVLGDGCGRDRSTWYHVAYETFPAPPRSWPSRDEWHPGTTSEQIAGALPTFARADAKGRDAACLAIAALDGAVRDLLPVGYQSVNEPAHARAFANHAPLVDMQSREDALRDLVELTRLRAEPICDPAPGARCGPRRPATSRAPIPALATPILAALQTAKEWAEHPRLAERVVGKVAEAYSQALAAKLPGAEAARDQLVRRIKALSATAPCGLTTTLKRAN